MTRPRLAADVVEAIRRERTAPRMTDPHGLHLRRLLRGLDRATASLSDADGPVVDVFCGTQPYRDRWPWRPVFGLDLDVHFGAADLIGDARLPVATSAVGGAVCTQALYFIRDGKALVDELQRVVAPGGFALISVPSRFRRERAAFERRYTRQDLARLFSAWQSVRLYGEGGPGTGLAYALGQLLRAVERRLPATRRVVRVECAAVNLVGTVVDVVTRPLGLDPAIIVLTARRPAR
ncbi:MAG: hypothetical protein ACRD0G_18750 [Acidimicrobiales bacterium]